ncbi:MAG: polyphosphate polymerase domain-containing protein [Acidobacteria bacterium]|nr:polyphosphate polymerase domain-containing protein [Acidobacteriota bacterium]
MIAKTEDAGSHAGLDLDSSLHFELASPDLAHARSLQQRVDRKYLLRVSDLEPLLRQLQSSHLAFRAGRTLWARYESVYFDTPDRDLYHAHRRGLRPRYKVRIRHHVDRQLTFLEVKRKDQNGRTVKLRHPLSFLHDGLGTAERQFIEDHSPIDASRLIPIVSSSFRRLTLVGRLIHERVTFDRDLLFRAGGHTEHVSRVVVAEVKRSRDDHRDGAAAELRTLRAQTQVISKYCLGTILLAPVRANVFKPAMRALERLSA